MQNQDVDMAGQPIDHAVNQAADTVHSWAETAPEYGGMWIDSFTREIHIAVADPAAEEIVADLQDTVPSEVQLHAHQVTHSWSALQALHHAVSEYLDQKGYRALYSVDSGLQVKTNDVRVRLEDSAPDEVLDDVRVAFARAPLQIERTTSRWTAY